MVSVKVMFCEMTEYHHDAASKKFTLMDTSKGYLAIEGLDIIQYRYSKIQVSYSIRATLKWRI